MKLKNISVLALALSMSLGGVVYANTSGVSGDVEISKEVIDSNTGDRILTGSVITGEYNDGIQNRASVSQTLEDTDGDGYYSFKLSSASDKVRFSLRNDGKARVDVAVYSSDTGSKIWGNRVNSGGAVTSSTYPLSSGKYYMEVVSDDGSAINVTFTARY